MDVTKVLRLPVTYTVNNCVETEDSRFLDITIDVLHTGLNFNGSRFSKETIDRNGDSIVNTPVLGYIALNPDGEKDFQGHEYEEITTEDGEKRYVYAGSAYGVIPESCNGRWTEKLCSDGIWREYYQVDALLWTKFEDAVSIFKRDGGKPQSMELGVDSIVAKELEDGTVEIIDFKFNGCCLLSSTDPDIEPAMINSVALPNFSMNKFAQEIKKQLDKYSCAVQKKEERTMDFSLTRKEEWDVICEQLKNHIYTDKWGYSFAQYYLIDIQENELIVEDRADNYRLYGIPYVCEGDKISISYDKCKKKKIQYMDYDESASDPVPLIDFSQAVTDVADYLAEQLKTVTNDYTNLKTTYDEIKPKYDQYVIDEKKRSDEAIAASKKIEFDKFDGHLSEFENYQKMKEHPEDYTLEQIKSECALLYTEKTLKTDFAKEKNQHTPTIAEVYDEQPQMEINSRYGAMQTK